MKSVTGGAVRVTESSIARGSGSGAGNRKSLISNFPRGDILEPTCTAPDPEQMTGKAEVDRRVMFLAQGLPLVEAT